MKNFKDFIFKASAYTVLVLSIFYIYGGIFNLNENGIHWSRFVIIASYCALISGTELLNSALNIKPVFKTLIHYSVLLVGFVFVFFIAGASEVKPATVLVAVVLFSVVYFAIFLVNLGLKKLNTKLHSTEEEKPKNNKPKKKEYKSLYSDN